MATTSRRWRCALVLFLASAMCLSCGRDRSTGAFDRFQPRTSDVLTVATELPAPGFWVGTDPRSVSGGFEYGIARELASRLGLDRVTVVAIPFGEIIDGNRTNEFDVGLARVTITDERADDVAFSTPYLDTDLGVLVRRGTEVPDVATALDLKWGVRRGTTAAEFLADRVFPRHPVAEFDDPAASYAALRAGRIDAVLRDTPLVLAEAAKSEDALEVVAQFASGDEYGAVLDKGSSNVEAVNAALRAMNDDGTLERLRERWLEPAFGEDPYDIPYLPTPR